MNVHLFFLPNSILIILKYTEGNPIKFRDPSGMSKTGDFWLNMRREITKGFKSAASAADHWARDNNIVYNNDIGKLAAAYHFSGMTPEAFALFYTVGKYHGETDDKTTWFDMNYSGNGNKDPFSGYNHKTKGREKTSTTLAVLWLIKESGDPLGNLYTMEQALAFFVYMISLLSPGPKTWADSLGQQHDNEVPGSQAENLHSCSTHISHFRATGNYLASAVKGLITGDAYKVPINGVIGGVLLGTINLGIDSTIRYRMAPLACITGPGR